jgi:RimJ/RimL family protein N-acetyltransferase
MTASRHCQRPHGARAGDAATEALRPSEGSASGGPPGGSRRALTVMSATPDASGAMEPLLLTDGTQLHVRPISPSDRKALAREFGRLSPESRRRRFLAPKRELSETELRRLTEIDHRSHEALVAIEAQSGRGVAVARYAGYAGEPERSEFAITVSDNWQGRGVGSALSRRLLIRAREEGVRVLEAIAFVDNHAALALLRGLGFRVCSVDGGIADLRLRLGSGVEYAEAA